ncbi:hypothetical protein KFE25_002494 [Diacronema lutheri]|uniref:PPM-type phosphatase domain-containing protein n=1 Tax=Diacronema lutheri TaxID=2081491 RepID=A0A8J5X9J5_DIALT|nr:hypothetical protein KFE25_002494 [Diacronema lutheri]
MPRPVARAAVPAGPEPPAYYSARFTSAMPALAWTHLGGRARVSKHDSRRPTQVGMQLGSMGSAAASLHTIAIDGQRCPVRSELHSALGIRQLASVSMVGYDAGNREKLNQDDMVGDAAFLDASSGFFAVMDGHGLHGDRCSNFLVRSIPYALREKLHGAPPSVQRAMRSLSTVREKAELDKAIKEVFLATNKALHASPIDTMLSGSTCCALLLLGKQLVTANVGDSRCIAAHFQMRAGRLTLVARALTTDHKPDSPTEKARIISRGGRVEPWAGAGLDDIQRVWLRDEETPGIAMSRSFGDDLAATVGIVAEPEVQFFELSDDLAFVLIASDGVWEFMSDQEVVDSIWLKRQMHGLTFHEAVDAVALESSAKWAENEGIVDDITILALAFMEV